MNTIYKGYLFNHLVKTLGLNPNCARNQIGVQKFEIVLIPKEMMESLGMTENQNQKWYQSN